MRDFKGMKDDKDIDNFFDEPEFSCGVARGLAVFGWLILAVAILISICSIAIATKQFATDKYAVPAAIALSFSTLFSACLLSYLLRGFALIIKSVYYIAKKQGML